MSTLTKEIFGESDSEEEEEEVLEEVAVEEAPKKRKRLSQKKKPQKKAAREEEAHQTAYDSGSEVSETAEDRAFLDTEGDDQELLAEYAAEKQQFDEAPDTDFESRPEPAATKPNPMDEALQKMRKRKKKEMSTDEKDKVVLQLLEKMSDAAAKDSTARNEGRPALRKLDMMDTVKRLFGQRTLHNTLLDFDALIVVGEWLSPNEDGSQPPLALRSGLLEALLPLEPAPEHLKKSNLGRLVMKYSRDKKETPDNRRLARTLVERWARPVVGKATSYHGLQAQQEAELGTSVKGVLPPRDPNLDDHDYIVPPDDGNENTRVRVPQFKGFDFVIRPQPAAANPSARGSRGPRPANFRPDSVKGRLSKKVQRRGSRAR